MAAVSSPTVPAHQSRAPSPGRRPEPEQRPRLQVVGPPRHTTRYVALLSLVTVLGVFGVVSLHALAAQAAFESQELESEVVELTQRHEELQAGVARLESPDRIRSVALDELGMVRTEEAGYVVLEPSSALAEHDEADEAEDLGDPLKQLMSAED